jgi:hypothetical protein
LRRQGNNRGVRSNIRDESGDFSHSANHTLEASMLAEQRL